jgi:hypothetical protein
LTAVGSKITKKHNASVKLLKQGVRYYESILPALHRGDVTAQELHKSTGWTEEHYENFKRRLTVEEDRAHFRRQLKLDQLAHKHLGILENLKASLMSVFSSRLIFRILSFLLIVASSTILFY